MNFRGANLAETLERQGAMDASRAREVVEGLLKGLGALHRRRIAHTQVAPHHVHVLEEKGAGARAVCRWRVICFRGICYSLGWLDWPDIIRGICGNGALCGGNAHRQSR